MQDKAPNPGDLLFKNLFGDRLIDNSLALIAEGVTASRLNAERLLSDVKFLYQAQRLSSARFLLTTAKEELAKSYILLDMCRLDFETHDSVLRRLCRAFYNHISKHAYLKVLDFPRIHTSADAKNAWDIEVQRWWPSTPESGEPNMPHDTYFDREFPLYIDFGDYDRRWLIPNDTDQFAYFATFLGANPIDEMEKLIEPWLTAESMGLCSPSVLECMNAVFKKHYIGDDIKLEELENLYEQVAKMVHHKVDGISQGSFMLSPLVEWPLYHFV
jgi:AbiV family abortive infection protein